VSMSDLADADRFVGARLPNRDLLNLHVTDDFLEHVREGQLDSLLKEVLAEACHEAWRSIKVEQGWTYGEPTDSSKKVHSRLKAYADLDEEGKEATD